MGSPQKNHALESIEYTLEMDFRVISCFLQTRPPRLWATKMSGRDDALQESRSDVRSLRRFVA